MRFARLILRRLILRLPVLRVPVLRRPILCLPVLALVAVAACADDSPESAAAAPVVRDSAGIRIVENSGPAWGEGDGWTVAAEPELVIDELAGVPVYQVGSIDVHSDGRLLVAHQSEQQLVILASDGSLVGTLGRRGEGPGEFTGLHAAFWIHGDSVLANEGNRRVTVFATADEGLRTMSVPASLSDAGSLSVRGALEDGRLVLDGWTDRFQPGTRIALGQIVATSAALEDPTHLATIPYARCLEVTNEGCGIETFGPLVTIDVGDDAVVSGFGTAYEVRRDTPPPAAETQVWRLRTEPVAVTEEMWNAYREAVGEGSASVLDDMARTQGIPGSLPFFQALVVGERGDVWVREEERLDSRFFTTDGVPDVRRRWGVFDGQGTFLGRVRLPAGFDLHVVTDDAVLGVHRDDFDVETIRRYPLDRGGG